MRHCCPRRCMSPARARSMSLPASSAARATRTRKRSASSSKSRTGFDAVARVVQASHVMRLEDPAVAICRGTALPSGVPRTLIVLGAARGGTTMVAQMLHDLGVFMGEGLDSTCQDNAMDGICRALFDGHIAIDHPLIEQVLRH